MKLTSCLSPAYLLPTLLDLQARKKVLIPKVRFKPMVVEIQGTLFDVVFKKSPQGKMIVTKKPDMSKVKWSKAQTKQRKRFKMGIAMIRVALADPKVRARYDRKAKRLKKRAWDLASSDYFKGKDLYAKK
jgi:Asp-tRNA(Asn)/Glu-tRNA(Gln) amidotransferase A subunit family amidase